MLENIKMILGITDNSKDNLLTYYIMSIERKILNYCNIIELPSELQPVIVDKVVGLMSGSNEVKSVTRGDTKIDYNIVNKSYLLDDVKAQLNRFRRVKFK